MTVNLEVLMYLAKIALAIAGVVALVYLAMLFKSMMDAMKTLEKTIESVNRDLVKLESPLNTIGQVSDTVDEVQASAKKAAMGAIKMFSERTSRFGAKKKKSASNDAAAQADGAVIVETETVKTAEKPADNADFQPIGKHAAVEETVKTTQTTTEFTTGDAE